MTDAFDLKEYSPISDLFDYNSVEIRDIYDQCVKKYLGIKEDRTRKFFNYLWENIESKIQLGSMSLSLSLKFDSLFLESEYQEAKGKLLGAGFVWKSEVMTVGLGKVISDLDIKIEFPEVYQ